MIEHKSKVISPTIMAGAMLASSTEPETDYAEWSAATSYALGQRVIRASMHRIYERLIAGTSATAPESDSTKWLDAGPTNRWAMFDDVVGTATSSASSITAVIFPGSISGIALLDVFGSSVDVVMKDAPGGTVVYSKSVEIDGTIIGTFYEWFYTPLVRNSNVILTDLPFHFSSCELTVSVNGTSDVSIGVCKFGEVIGIGSAEYGATSGITDYSVKTVDSFGRYSIIKRGYSKKMSFKMLTDKVDYNRISIALTKLRATPAVWIASESPDSEPLTVYGFYKDFSIDVAYATMNYCSLEIEGLI